MLGQYRLGKVRFSAQYRIELYIEMIFLHIVSKFTGLVVIDPGAFQ